MGEKRTTEKFNKVPKQKKPKNLNRVRKIVTPPDIELAGLKVWIHKYEFSSTGNFYDSNWLVATACCTGRESEIWIKGAFLLTTDLESWAICLEAFDFAPERILELISLQNQLMINLVIRTPERLHIKVEITPCGSEQHFYYYDAEPSAVNKLVEDIKKVLGKFPVRGR